MRVVRLDGQATTASATAVGSQPDVAANRADASDVCRPRGSPRPTWCSPPHVVVTVPKAQAQNAD
jgi:hypothetical protein